MRPRVVHILFVAVLFFASGVAAQEVVQPRRQVTESGSAYLKALRFRGVDTEAVYYDPLGPIPPLDASRQPEPPAEDWTDVEWGTPRIVTVVVTASILAALAYLLVRYGGGISVSLRQEMANPGRSRRRVRASDATEGEPVPGTLDALLRIEDRRRAVMLLAQSALLRVLGAHGVLPQRSWTARDALRHIPAGQAHLDALRALVLASERVHFGGRDVSEGEFDALVEEIRPLFGATGP
ncbi:hypothetical protein GGD81_003047 [Rhodobium orientis]|uniref:Protein-glutamine gamma-glutamyltransferase-like C-terminal domain-containing protein n=1 Tax=Rhodobium orientis TaxID=34017 RepID=A0A327JVI3_9HYPH|nr:DUF4129 domain-containing protein [Rhodobium orientis]MBB4303992.1 hypothetical protein [Rhodobium orientis]MBK5950798.1 hypothetical protein [Rhodobium orientis]RAI29534.1 hypothetical protein CH339_02480 [Rhodobium orientis]